MNTRFSLAVLPFRELGFFTIFSSPTLLDLTLWYCQLDRNSPDTCLFFVKLSYVNQFPKLISRFLFFITL